MHIQFNTDNNITGSEELRAPLEGMITRSMARYAAQVTRIEVHLADENSHKEGNSNDKRCRLEARLGQMQPVTVTNYANTHEEAVKGAIDKLKASLDTKIGRLKNY